jgi:hypothetical protein
VFKYNNEVLENILERDKLVLRMRGREIASTRGYMAVISFLSESFWPIRVDIRICFDIKRACLCSSTRRFLATATWMLLNCRSNCLKLWNAEGKVRNGQAN